MEAILQHLRDDKESPVQRTGTKRRESDKISEAIRKLGVALVDIIPIILRNGHDKQIHDKKHISVRWLVELCRSVSSDLSPELLARVIIDASHLKDETHQQALLFDSLGESEKALQVLSEVTPLLSTIRDSISSSDFDEAIRKGEFVDSVVVDLDQERRNFIRQEAIEAAQFAVMAKADYEILLGESSSLTDIKTKTHIVARASHIEAKKLVDKAEKRAHLLMKRAQDAGAILDDDALAFLDKSQWEGSVGFGSGGLLNRTEQEIQSFQQSLLPEGTRKYYDKRGLPTGTIIEDRDGMERVIIPSVKVDESNLHQRLVIKDIITDTDLARAFDGTESLNPMQSETFEVAFHCRDNMLVCAPTGAGKTNVAMLTAVSHFRDVGVLGISSDDSSRNKTMETGEKVIYIAPMKALAQEVVEKFSAKLKPLGLQVRELTGDMQLSRRETETANLIVTTPEKWDVVTRKSGSDEKALGNQCGLLIIDEVHLLADERGAVIESVVSRLHRLVESRQRQVRIVALSATLPNYSDVAEFLQVPKKGLFYFGPEYRPVPLQQTFTGLRLKSKDRNLKEQKLNEACFDTVVESLKRGYQVMVFVHSRKGTGDTASALAELASKEGVLESAFVTAGKEGLMGDAYRKYVDKVQKSRNRQVATLFQYGMGIHHAGMLRSDRKLSETMFHDGAIKVLCCTATLAWGINLPAHSIVIKGTDVYNPEKGGTVDLSILDVQQIFGRAGRPQFDSSGEATLITTHDAFQRYMDKLVRPIPIESCFTKQLADHLNAEVVSGTVSNLAEAAKWLKYTYLYIRMVGNPQAYGITLDEKADDPTLHRRCIELVTNAAKLLDRTQMLRYDVESGNLGVTSNGRVAAHFYIQAESMETFQDIFKLNTNPNDQALFVLICSANEFRNMKLRQEEMDELQELILEACPMQLKGSGLTDDGVPLVTSHVDKAFVLMQAYISRAKIKSFTLVSDMNYIASNAGRVARALFEMCLNKKKSGSAAKLLRIAKSIESQFWWFQTPLRHFELELDGHIFSALELDSGRRGKGSFDMLLELLELQPGEIANLCKCSRQVGSKIQSLIRMLPNLNVSCEIKPVTGSIVMFSICLKSEFSWHDRWHGNTQSFWVWVEDGENDEIYHHEHLSLPKRRYVDPVILRFSMPLFSSNSRHYNVRVIADGWVGVEQVWSIPLENITLPTNEMLHTKLLNLTPLLKSALQNPLYEKLFSKIEVFNPIQTQLFHVLYHTDMPVLLGAPTASGKTIIAELALLRMKTVNPNGICVYIAPLKSLARERLKEWQARFGAAPFDWVILELSGDTSYDQLVLQDADVLICTPEKWDLISRGWRGFVNTPTGDGLAIGKMFVKRVCLLVLDEVHLLGEDRGAVLEAIVSRTRYISQVMQRHLDTDGKYATVEGTRILGLSTALANAGDLADWIGIGALITGMKKRIGLYNFKPSVRPVPTKIHIQGYPGKHYCPRMASMNKPCFATIKEKSASKPVLVFVGSRRQTRLTAFDIIKYAANDEDPKIFLNCTDDWIHAVTERIQDESLRHVLTFGIGLHHAGLSKTDREVVENLFIERKIQVLVATATLAWGVNLPAHLVIVKGTEYFDGKTSRYVDYPITDVLQMVGRAGRPGFDTTAQAVVMVSEEKKDFYKKFLYNPFPVESCLGERLGEILNAEIAAGTITTFKECLGYLTWTFFARRVRANPSYYGAKSSSDEDVGEHFHSVITMTIKKLKDSECVTFNGDDGSSLITPTTLGIACANFYLKLMTPQQMFIGLLETQKVLDKVLADKSPLLRHPSVRTQKAPFNQHDSVEEISCAWLLYVISSTHEFDENPVRHNEEFLNEELCTRLMWGHDPSFILSGKQGLKNPNIDVFKDAHTKCFLLLQAYLQRVRLPISDYINDTKAVIDQIPRLLAAMEFITWKEISGPCSFELLTQFSRLRQLVETRSTVRTDPLEQLFRFRESDRQQLVSKFKGNEASPLLLSDLRSLPRHKARAILQSHLKESNQTDNLDRVLVALYDYPFLSKANGMLSVYNGYSLGKLDLSMTFDREAGHDAIEKKRDSYSYSILVGSIDERIILARETIRIHQFGKWEVNQELTFEWPDAEVKEGNRFVVVRFLLNELRGLDFEMVVGVTGKSSTT